MLSRASRIGPPATVGSSPVMAVSCSSTSQPAYPCACRASMTSAIRASPLPSGKNRPPRVASTSEHRPALKSAATCASTSLRCACTTRSPCARANCGDVDARCPGTSRARAPLTCSASRSAPPCVGRDDTDPWGDGPSAPPSRASSGSRTATKSARPGQLRSVDRRRRTISSARVRRLPEFAWVSPLSGAELGALAANLCRRLERHHAPARSQPPECGDSRSPRRPLRVSSRPRAEGSPRTEPPRFYHPQADGNARSSGGVVPVSPFCRRAR